MAPPQILSRTQRRHEQKQTVLVLALVAVVALLSFFAGIMVGRGMTPAEPMAAATPVPSPRLPVPPPPLAASVATPVATTTEPGSLPAPAGVRPEQLAFYDSLAKGEQLPLGSGINLPPPNVAPPPEPAGDFVEKPAPAAVKPSANKTQTPTEKNIDATTKSVAPAAKTSTPAGKPVATTTKTSAKIKSTTTDTTKSADKTAAGNVAAPASKKAAKSPAVGSYVIQAASYHKAQEAAELSRRLSRKGYTPFVEAIDLGSKGLWHRVYVGPFSSVAAADKIAKRLKSEERLAPVVRKR